MNRPRGQIGLIKIRPPLERDEERELHVLIVEGRSAASELDEPGERSLERRTILRRRVRRGRQAEEELLAGTCALVKERVNRLGFPMDRDDLEAAGLEGLVTALREFDPTRDIRFATYANYWITKMVMAAISNRVPYPESDIRLIMRYRKLAGPSGRIPTVAETAKALGVTRGEASRIAQMDVDIRSGMARIEAAGPDVEAPSVASVDAEWVIDALRRILGDDFEDYWMWTGKVMSLDELGRRNGISKQAMAKRVAKWRRMVEAAPEADRMVAWLRAQ